MILSKKYKEELDKIVMSEDMKKRILHNVLKENVEVKSGEMEIKKNINFKRKMTIAAACFTVAVCVSVAKNNKQILTIENRNIRQEEVSKDKDIENKILPNSEESKVSDAMKNNGEEDSNINQTSEVSGEYGNNDERQEKNDTGRYDDKNNNLNESSESSKLSDSDINKESKANNENSNPYGNSSASKQKRKGSEPSVANSNSGVKINSEESANPIGSTDILKNNVIDKNETNDMNKKEDSQGVLVGSYIKEYKTLEEAESAVKFNINTIKSMPKGFNIDNLTVISNEIIEITYKNKEQDVINFRAGKEIDNISGDYSIYEVEKTLKINGVNVNLKGNKEKIFNLATWEKDNISYSISLINGNNEDDILNMIKSTTDT